MLFYDGDNVFCENITHNLSNMADAAGVYECLWRPKENNFKVAGDIIKPLEEGLTDLVLNKAKYTEHNSSNGWGVYEDFVRFVVDVLAACKEHEYADIGVCK